MESKRVGIMGGTFDPIHYGHLLLAENALESFSLDHIIFLPAGMPYMKSLQPVSSAFLRLKMTELATENHPSFQVSSMEIMQKNNTYTCDTLKVLTEQNPDTHYFFIMGADSLFHIESWKNPQQIFSLCTILVSVRENLDRTMLENKMYHLQQCFQADIQILPVRTIDISSTEIRKRIHSGNSVRYMLPEEVLCFISKEKLYQEKEALECVNNETGRYC